MYIRIRNLQAPQHAPHFGFRTGCRLRMRIPSSLQQFHQQRTQARQLAGCRTRLTLRRRLCRFSRQLPKAHRHRLPKIHRGLRILGRNPHQPVTMLQILAPQTVLLRSKQQRHSPLRQRRAHRGGSLFQRNQRLLELAPTRRSSADHQPAIRHCFGNARKLSRVAKHRTRTHARTRFTKRRLIGRNQTQILDAEILHCARNGANVQRIARTHQHDRQLPQLIRQHNRPSMDIAPISRPPDSELSLYNHPLSPMASPSSASSIANTGSSQASSARNRIVVVFLLISALYFADTLLRASLKTFWYDELVTVYLCKLPSFGATWSAVLHGGADLNPPLFYLFTRWSQYFFGEGLIATRLPEILGVWLFGLSLYLFVSRRLGPLRAAIAALFPVFTLAHYYAYEARPHGAVLGCVGLMMLCWQRAHEGKKIFLWDALLGLSYLAALLLHVYAVYLLIPFLIAEVISGARQRRLHFGSIAALLLAPLCVASLYLRLYRNFSSGGLSGIHIHLYELVQHYFVFVLGPAIVVLLLLLLFLACSHFMVGASPTFQDLRSLSADELSLAFGLAVLPAIGVVCIKLSHAYYFDRYFLAATAGYALLLAQATLVRGGRSFVARSLFFSMIALLSADTLIAAYCHWRHADLDQVDPSSGIAFVPNPADPLMRDAALLRNTTNLSILVTDEPAYLYLYYYAPPQIRSRLVFGASSDSPFLNGYRRLARWANVDLHLATYDQFFATQNDFLVYSSNNWSYRSGCRNCQGQFLKAGYTLRSVDEDADHYLEHFSK